jgi:hypothetical protein
MRIGCMHIFCFVSACFSKIKIHLANMSLRFGPEQNIGELLDDCVRYIQIQLGQARNFCNVLA